MSSRVLDVAGVRALVCESRGPLIASEREAADLVGEALSAEARLVAIPLARLSPAFLDLKTGLAGAVLQKFVNYHRRVAILGDISQAVSASQALRDFVYESNRGRTVWFVPDLPALEAKLAQG